LARTSAGNIGNPCAQPTRVEKERFLGCRRPRPTIDQFREMKSGNRRRDPRRRVGGKRISRSGSNRMAACSSPTLPSWTRCPLAGWRRPSGRRLDREFVQRRKPPSLRASGERGRIHDPTKAIRLVTLQHDPEADC
jgi:hypothetical protein